MNRSSSVEPVVLIMTNKDERGKNKNSDMDTDNETSVKTVM